MFSVFLCYYKSVAFKLLRLSVEIRNSRAYTNTNHGRTQHLKNLTYRSQKGSLRGLDKLIGKWYIDYDNIIT